MTTKRCLVVEDEDSGRDILTILLNFHQIEVDAVESGEEALELLKMHAYEAVLVDLLLPGIDGWELLKQIKANSATTHLKVIAITAYYDPVLAHTARKAGFTGCYSKPVTPDFMPIFFEMLNPITESDSSP